MIYNKKKIEKRVSIFWEVGEVRRAAIFRLRRRAKVVVSPGPNEAGYETHRVPSYDLDTPDALENQIGPSVWPLCFEVIKPEPPKLEIWEIG